MNITKDNEGDDGYSLLGSKDDKMGPLGDKDKPFEANKYHPTTANPFPFNSAEYRELLKRKASVEGFNRRMMENKKGHERE